MSEHALRDTSTAEAPWTVVEATDARYRNLTVGATLLDAMQQAARSQAPPGGAARAPPPPPAPVDARDVIEELDLSQTLSRRAVRQELPKLQARLNALSRHKRFRDAPCVLVFEGNDAAGKGGAIRRVTRALDARRYDVVPIAAPDRRGARAAVPVALLAAPAAARPLHHLRPQLVRARARRARRGVRRRARLDARVPRRSSTSRSRWRAPAIVVVKFWLAISQEEQLARFQAREKTPFKRFKITADDWRNRKKWEAYERAVCDMVDRTSTERGARGTSSRPTTRSGRASACSRRSETPSRMHSGSDESLLPGQPVVSGRCQTSAGPARTAPVRLDSWFVLAVAAVAAGAAASACGGGDPASPTFVPVATSVLVDAGSSPAGDGSAETIEAVFASCGPSPATGSIPADVASVLSDRCQPCHTDPPLNGAPFPLLTYEDVHQLFAGTIPIYQEMYMLIQPGPRRTCRSATRRSSRPTSSRRCSDWLLACAPPPYGRWKRKSQFPRGAVARRHRGVQSCPSCPGGSPAIRTACATVVVWPRARCC